MYKALIEKFNIDGNFKQLDLKDIGLRKKMGIYFNEHSLLFVISQKSRVLLKDAARFQEIYENVKRFTGTGFKNKIIIIDSPLCSKAEKELENLKWEVKYE